MKPRSGLTLQFFVPLGWALLLFFFFLSDVLTMKAGFVAGDYMAQVYPWLHEYALQLRAGQWSLWTPWVQSGMDLFAEGQTAMLYAPNLLLFSIFPFKVAYNLLFAGHFLAALILFYLYARHRGLSSYAASFASLSFSFGSAYAGGFYGIFSLRPLTWFPLALYLIDKYWDKGSKTYLGLLALVLGQACLAGYPQMTAYMFLFLGIYVLLKIESREEWKSAYAKIAGMALAMGLALLIGLPQLWATWEIAGYSTRVFQDKSFVLWGSAAPWTALTLFFYAWGPLLRGHIYLGMLPAFLLLTQGSWKLCRKEWILVMIAVALALGAFNPFYWVLIHLPGASLLRNPSKFLYFALFFLSLIAAHLWDRQFSNTDRLTPVIARHNEGGSVLRRTSPRRGRLVRRSLGEGGSNLTEARGLSTILYRSQCLMAFIAAIMLMAFFAARWGARLLESFGVWYVEQFVVGKSFHRYSPEHYMDLLGQILASLQHETSLGHIFFWMPLILSGWVLVLFVARRHLSKTAWTHAALLMLTLDLGIFTATSYGTGFFGNTQPFPDLTMQRQLPKEGKWMDLLLGPQTLFSKNRGMLTHHASVGVYSPLADGEYFQLLGQTGVVDDGFGQIEPNIQEIQRLKPMLDFMGLRFIITDTQTKIDDFTLWRETGGRRIWRNEKAAPEFQWISKNNTPAQIHIRTQSNDKVIVDIQSSHPGTLSRNTRFAPGWHVRINNQEAQLFRIHNLFQAVQIPAGQSEVIFTFKPNYWTWGFPVHILAIFAALLPLAFQSQKSKDKSQK